MSFSGIRARIRQESSPTVYSQSSSPQKDVPSGSNSSPPIRPERRAGLFRKKSASDLSAPTAATTTPAAARSSATPSSSISPGPTGSPTAHRRVHQRSPSSASSIVSNAAQSVREMAARTNGTNVTPSPSSQAHAIPSPESTRRQKYSRDDVLRYRAGQMPATSSPLPSQRSPVPRTALPSPTSSMPSSSAGAARSGLLARGNTPKTSAVTQDLASMERHHNDHGPSAIRSSDLTSGEIECMASRTPSPTNSSAKKQLRPASTSSHRASGHNSTTPSLPNGSIPSYPSTVTDSSSRIGKPLPRPCKSDRSDGSNARKSIFEWTPATGIPSLVRRGSKGSAATLGNGEQSAKQSPFGFLRTASALGHRRSESRQTRRDDESSDDEDEEHMSEQARRHFRKPSNSPSFFAGITGHSHTPSLLRQPAGQTSKSSLPLFRRPRTSSQGAISLLDGSKPPTIANQSSSAMDMSSLEPPRRTNTALAGRFSETQASALKHGGANGGFFSSLTKAKSRDVFTQDDSMSSARDLAASSQLTGLARPSTAIGHYDPAPGNEEQRDSRPSISSYRSSRDDSSSSRPASRRRRIPSIYSLASVRLTGSNGDADTSESVEQSAPAAAVGPGWRFGKAWIKSRKDANPGTSSATPYTDTGVTAFDTQLSPNANPATRKWRQLIEASSSSSSLDAPVESIGLIFGVPLREAVIRTRFISPVVDDFISTSSTLSTGTTSSTSSSPFASNISSAPSSRHPRRRPSKIGLLDLGSDFSLSSDIFSSATSSSSQASSLATSSSTHNLALQLAPESSMPPSQARRFKQTPVDRALARKQYLPRFVTRCIESLETYGKDEEGVYRLTGRSSHTARIRQLFDGRLDLRISGMPLSGQQDEEIDWDIDLKALPPSECDNNAVCSAFKAYLRELPTPILNKAQLSRLDVAMKAKRAEKSAGHSSDDNAVLLRDAFQDLEPAKWYLLRELALHLGDMTSLEVVSKTKMTLNNLSLVLAPTLCIPVTTLNFIIQFQGVLFEESPQEDAQLDRVREGDVIGGISSQSSSHDNTSNGGALKSFSFPASSSAAASTPVSPSSIPIATARKANGDGPGPVARLRFTSSGLGQGRDTQLLSAPAPKNHRDSQASVATVTPGERDDFADDSASTVNLHSPADLSLAETSGSSALPPQSPHSFVPAARHSPSSGIARALDSAVTTSPTSSTRLGKVSAAESEASPSQTEQRGGATVNKPADGFSPGSNGHQSGRNQDSSYLLAPSPFVTHHQTARRGSGPDGARTGLRSSESTASLASNASSASGSGSGSNNYYTSAPASRNNSSIHLPTTNSAVSGKLPGADSERNSEPKSPRSPNSDGPKDAIVTNGTGRSGSAFLDRPRPPLGGNFWAGGRSSPLPPSPRRKTTSETAAASMRQKNTSISKTDSISSSPQRQDIISDNSFTERTDIAEPAVRRRF